MTDQEQLQYLFDTSLNHIRKQGTYALSDQALKSNEKDPERPSIQCGYLNHKGHKCAAGVFIRDGSILQESGYNWTNLIDYTERNPGLQGDLDPIAVSRDLFVKDMQYAHDESVRGNIGNNWGFMEEYERRMRKIALNRGLVYNPPLTAEERV